MKQIICRLLFVALLGTQIATASASVFHKWIDENGVTHYSDTVPEEVTAVFEVTVEEAMSGSSDAAKNDFYSIANQWNRVNRERIAREKRNQEMARLQPRKKLLSGTRAGQVSAPPEQKQCAKKSRRSGYANFHASRYHPWPIKKLYKKKHHKPAVPSTPVKRIGETGKASGSRLSREPQA